MSDECSVSDLGACYWCERVAKERDEARAVARSLWRGLFSKDRTFGLGPTEYSYPWLTEEEAP